MNRFDWPALMRAGMHGLGLRPDQFRPLPPPSYFSFSGRTQEQRHSTARGFSISQTEFPDQDRREI